MKANGRQLSKIIKRIEPTDRQSFILDCLVINFINYSGAVRSSLVDLDPVGFPMRITLVYFGFYSCSSASELINVDFSYY